MNVLGTRAALALLLVIAASAANAVDLNLDSVMQRTRSGEFPLKVDTRARFDFDPATGTLSSSGTWTAQSVTGGASPYTRFSHKVENLRVTADGHFSVKSYECVEGTFSAILAANICGNYRFGPNMLDDGGLGDDVVAGPPKSLAPYTVTGLTWDGQSLVLTLSAEGLTDGDVFAEYGLTLRFSAIVPLQEQPAR